MSKDREVARIAEAHVLEGVGCFGVVGVVYCKCGYPIMRSFADGGSIPNYELLDSEPVSSRSRDYVCPNCSWLVMTEEW